MWFDHIIVFCTVGHRSEISSDILKRELLGLKWVGNTTR